jgi:hypothetical protein
MPDFFPLYMVLSRDADVYTTNLDRLLLFSIYFWLSFSAIIDLSILVYSFFCLLSYLVVISVIHISVLLPEASRRFWSLLVFCLGRF